ncbi:MAG: porin family protein [Proteobacteria bacterium]|nr:porin family protein [Pseudomonadota bacterium]
MRSAIERALAGAVALMSVTAVNAADLPPIMPPIYKAPPPIEAFSGWYLRGDIGMSNQRVGSLWNVLYGNADSVINIDKTFDSAPLFGIGVGYQFNNWLRGDLTGEYRANAHFHGLDVARFGNVVFPDDYNASKSEWLFLANAYVDLGTWWGVTPFVGAGVGFSRNTISGFRDVGSTQVGATILSTAYGGTAHTWNFAWAAHAGLAYHVTPNFIVELAYRYVDLGNARSGDLIGFDGTNNTFNPMHFRDITSHDLKLGVRWMLGGEPPPPYYAPPLVRKG